MNVNDIKYGFKSCLPDKQKASTKYYKTSYKKFEDLTFDEKVRRKEMLDRPVDPEVARAYNFLRRPGRLARTLVFW